MRQRVSYSSLPPKIKKTLRWLFLSLGVSFILMITGAVLIESESPAGQYVIITSVVGFVVTIISINIITRKFRRK